MKREFVSAVLAVSLFASTAYADPISIPDAPPLTPGEVSVGLAISPIKKGQVAPFTGVLLSPEATASIIVQLNSIDDQLRIELDRARAADRAQCDFELNEQKSTSDADKRILQAQLDERSQQIANLSKIVDDVQGQNSNLPLWVGISAGAGFLLGVAVSVVTVYVMNQSLQTN